MEEGKVEAFLQETAADAPTPAVCAAVAEFVAEQQRRNRLVVVITSGGTLVPLERNMVRYVDNFSGGRRGAAAAEAFIEQGCAVIFCFRSYTMEPYARQLPNGNRLLSLLAETPLPANVVNAAAQLKHAQDEKLLLQLPYNSVGDYLQLMMVLAKALQPLGKRAMLFLAAAVADFYVPTSQMAEHKIQSREHNELELRLQPVPKMLKHIRTHGCPEAYVISFKLETDSSLLRGKALSALEKYGHHGVVANLLHTRHQEVVIFPGECAVRAPTVAAAAAATVGGAGVGSKGSGDLEPELCRVILERWQAWRGE